MFHFIYKENDKKSNIFTLLKSFFSMEVARENKSIKNDQKQSEIYLLTHSCKMWKNGQIYI